MLHVTTKSLEALVTAFGIGAGVGSVINFSIGVSDYHLDIKLYLWLFSFNVLLRHFLMHLENYIYHIRFRWFVWMDGLHLIL